MNRQDAKEILNPLLDALDAMYEVERVIAGLGKQERTQFHRSLHQVLGALEDKLLFPICEQYPDFLPTREEEPPRILYGELTWGDVKLPASVTADQLDEVILSLLKPRWQKILMFVLNAEKRYQELGWAISREATAARLQVLSDLDRIEGLGDMRYWGNSEVRLKD